MSSPSEKKAFKDWFTILETLKDDPSPYVRRSVSNCINDIAKDHPEAVLDRCEAWQRHAAPERLVLIRHALRSLIKTGHPRALALMGFAVQPALTAVPTLNSSTCHIGGTVELHAELTATGNAPQSILLDFVIVFAGKTGAPREKVFKWTSLTLAPGETRTLHKTLTCFRPTSVRALYPGEHRIHLQLNGTRMGLAVLHLHEGPERT